MKIDNLRSMDRGAVIHADIVVIGGGPSAYAIAHELRGENAKILILESGDIKEEPRYEALNAVESIGEPMGEARIAKRRAYHGANSPTWTHEIQQFGVRCRVLGGSSHAWAGKSAAFGDVDFQKRAWVANSGWPFGLETLRPFIDRAAELLNLGPNCYDERFWDVLGSPPPKPELDPSLLRSFFWQFARSRIDRLDFVRFGRKFGLLEASNMQVLVNATVTRIHTTEGGRAVKGVEASTIDGVRYQVSADMVILAAGGIENARLLLAGGGPEGGAIGNQHGLVGRFLMDHPSATIGWFKAEDHKSLFDRFGFFGLKQPDGTHVYLHGLELSPELQKDDGLLHCATYISGIRALDDPLDALKRLARGRSKSPMADLKAVLGSPGVVAKSVGAQMLGSDSAPRGLQKFVIDTLLRYFPNFVVSQYQDRGFPHKLKAISIEAICEQPPEAESRIVLSNRVDALGVPIAKVDWRLGLNVPKTMIRLGKVMESEFARVGLPAPILEPWVSENRPEDAVLIDVAHTLGSTRMSDDPKLGVVDANCQVHGVEGLYVAGASVFPTSGHANPTLMILALAVRLADHIKDVRSVSKTVPPVSALDKVAV